MPSTPSSVIFSCDRVFDFDVGDDERGFGVNERIAFAGGDCQRIEMKPGDFFWPPMPPMVKENCSASGGPMSLLLASMVTPSLFGEFSGDHRGGSAGVEQETAGRPFTVVRNDDRRLAPLPVIGFGPMNGLSASVGPGPLAGVSFVKGLKSA